MTSPQAMSGQTLRIIDANLNRLGEGLRLLEEIARFMLDDAALTQQLKTMRHELIRSDYPFQNSSFSLETQQAMLASILKSPARRKRESYLWCWWLTPGGYRNR